MVIRSIAVRVIGPALVLCAIVASSLVAIGAASSDGPKATASASVAKQLKKLKRQVAGLESQVDALAAQPGPQGPAGAAGAPPPPCQGNDPSDVMVLAGSLCVDKYEASIWDAPTGGNQITGAIPCNANGQNCSNIYARSAAGVQPRVQITWLQAQRALANSGKRLLTNAEWQQAVAGTPDSTACNINNPPLSNTGANAGCVSRFGVNDMIGNIEEAVGDWDEEYPDAAGCPNWPAAYGNDGSCVGGGTSTRFPGVFTRGGHLINDTSAGAFTIWLSENPSDASSGFRGAR